MVVAFLGLAGSRGRQVEQEDPAAEPAAGAAPAA